MSIFCQFSSLTSSIYWPIQYKETKNEQILKTACQIFFKQNYNDQYTQSNMGRANPNTLSLVHSLHGYAHSLVSRCSLPVAEMGTAGSKSGGLLNCGLRVAGHRLHCGLRVAGHRLRAAGCRPHSGCGLRVAGHTQIAGCGPQIAGC